MGLGSEVSGIFVASWSKASRGWELLYVGYTKLTIAHRDKSNSATRNEWTGIVSQIDADRGNKSKF